MVLEHQSFIDADFLLTRMLPAPNYDGLKLQTSNYYLGPEMDPGLERGNRAEDQIRNTFNRLIKNTAYCTEYCNVNSTIPDETDNFNPLLWV
jgi:hypothetical protein